MRIPKRFAIVGQPHLYSLVEMVVANADDADLCEWLRHAQVDEVFQASSDAGPDTTVQRVA